MRRRTQVGLNKGRGAPCPQARHQLPPTRRTARPNRGRTALPGRCLRPRRTGRGLASARRPPSAAAWSTGAIVALLFRGALRRSDVAALCSADVDFGDGDDVRRHRPPLEVRPDRGGHADVRHLVGGCAAAVRSLHAAVSPESGDSLVLASTRSTAGSPAACAAAGLRGPQDVRTAAASGSPSSSPRGVSTHAHPARQCRHGRQLRRVGAGVSQGPHRSRSRPGSTRDPGARRPRARRSCSPNWTMSSRMSACWSSQISQKALGRSVGRERSARWSRRLKLRHSHL